MLKVRIIPAIFFSNGWLVQTYKFDNFRFIGTPDKTAERLSAWGSDELIFIDISRGRKLKLRTDIKNKSSLNFLTHLKKISKLINIPLTVGGKIKTLKNINDRLIKGADKVIINSQFHIDNNFIRQASKEFGSQSIVACIDVKKINNIYCPVFNSGTEVSNHSLKNWINYLMDNGAGEIMINNIDLDGTLRGFDLELAKLAKSIVKKPLIFCGGAGNANDFLKLYKKTKINAICGANFFNYHEHSTHPYNQALDKRMFLDLKQLSNHFEITSIF